MAKGWIEDWNAEDEDFWERMGKSIARRNLLLSIFAEFLGFSVWSLWSVTAVFLNQAGFDFSPGQLFTLVAVPAIVGATMRFPYTLAVPKFGGRNWTVCSALLLLVPVGLLVALVSRPGTPFWAFLIGGAFAGLGGGNFASSMANISFFYPDRKKGLALGLNAAGGNMGVAAAQLLVPIAVTWQAAGRIGGGIELLKAAVPCERRACMDSLHPYRGPAGLVLHGQPEGVHGLAQAAVCRVQAKADVGPVVAVRRHFWLVYRLLGGAAIAHQD